MDEKDILNDNTPAEPTPGEELLAQPEVVTEILPDLAAISAAGLKTPADAEMDRLLADARIQSGMEYPTTESFRDEAYREAFGEGEELRRARKWQKPSENRS